MSSSFVKDCSDVSAPGNSSSGKTVIIIVNNETGNVSLDQDELQNLLASHGADGSQVSVVRMGSGGVGGVIGNPGDIVTSPSIVATADGTAHVNFTVEGYPAIPLEGQVSGGMNYAELPLDQDAFQRLESVLESEEAREILGEPLLNMVANPDQLGTLDQLMDSSLFEGTEQDNVNDAENVNSEGITSSKKTRSPPKRRSQRQMDKAEREEVEKILAENKKLLQEEKQQLGEQQIVENMRKMQTIDEDEETEDEEMEEDESDGDEEDGSENVVSRKTAISKKRGKVSGKGRGKVRGKGKLDTEKEKLQDPKGKGKGKKKIEEEDQEVGLGRGGGRGKGRGNVKEGNIGNGKGRGRGALKKDGETSIGKKLESNTTDKAVGVVGRRKKSDVSDNDEEKAKPLKSVKKGEIESVNEKSNRNEKEDKKSQRDNSKVGIKDSLDDKKAGNQKDQKNGVNETERKLRKGIKGKEDDDAKLGDSRSVEKKLNKEKGDGSDGGKKLKLRKSARSKGSSEENDESGANLKKSQSEKESDNDKLRSKQGIKGSSETVSEDENSARTKEIVSVEEKGNAAVGKAHARKCLKERGDDSEALKNQKQGSSLDTVKDVGRRKIMVRTQKKYNIDGSNEAVFSEGVKGREDKEMDVDTAITTNENVTGVNAGCSGTQVKSFGLPIDKFNIEAALAKEMFGELDLSVKPSAVRPRGNLGENKDPEGQKSVACSKSIADLSAEIFGDSELPDLEVDIKGKKALSATPKFISDFHPPVSSTPNTIASIKKIESPSETILFDDYKVKNEPRNLLRKKIISKEPKMDQQDVLSTQVSGSRNVEAKPLSKSEVMVVKTKVQKENVNANTVKDVGKEMEDQNKMSPEKIGEGRSRLIQVKSPVGIRQVVVLNSAKSTAKETLVKVIDPIDPPREEDRLTVAQICANAKKEAAMKRKLDLQKKKTTDVDNASSEMTEFKSNSEIAGMQIKNVKNKGKMEKISKTEFQKKEPPPKIVDLEMKLEDSVQLKKKEAQRKREEIQRKREEILRKREAIKLRKEQQMREIMQMKREENHEQSEQEKIEKPVQKVKTISVSVKNSVTESQRSSSSNQESLAKREVQVIVQSNKGHGLQRAESVEFLSRVKGQMASPKKPPLEIAQKNKVKIPITKNESTSKKPVRKEPVISIKTKKVEEHPRPFAPVEESPVRRSGRAIKKKTFGDEMLTFDLKEEKNPDGEGESGSEEEPESEEEDEDSIEDYDDPERLWCICQKPHNNRFMICCDRCEDWFHGTCVGITKAMGQQMEDERQEWVCPKCKKAEKALKSTGISLPQKKEPVSVIALGSTPAPKGKAEPKKALNNEGKKEMQISPTASKKVSQGLKKVESLSSLKNVEETPVEDEASDIIETSASSSTSNRISEEEPKCVLESCNRPRKPDWIYCSNECVLKHAQLSLKIMGKTDKDLEEHQIPGVTPGTLKSEPRVLVYEKTTGKILSGSEAPSLREVKVWLKDNPNYAILHPGMMKTSGAVLKTVKPDGSVSGTDISGQNKVIHVSTPSSLTPVKATPQKLTVVKSADGRIIVKAAEALSKGFINTSATVSKTALTSNTPKPVVVSTKGSVVKDTETEGIENDPRILPAIDEDEELDLALAKKNADNLLKSGADSSPVKKSVENGQQKVIDPSKVIESLKLSDSVTFKSIESLPAKALDASSKVTSPIKDMKKTPPKLGAVEKKANDPNIVRNNVKKTLAECLLKRSKEATSEFEDLTEEDINELADEIEKELFMFFSKDVGFKYKSRYRSLLFNIRDTKNSGLFRKILNGTITPSNLAKMTSEELASKELAEWREREEKKELQAIEKYELDMISLGNQYIMKSHKGEIEIDKDEFIKDKEKAPETINALPTDPVMGLLGDTSSGHKNHMYDVNCKICTGKQDSTAVSQDLKYKGKHEDKKELKDDRSEEEKLKDRKERKSSSDRDKSKERHRHRSRDYDKEKSKKHKRERSKEREKGDNRSKSREAGKERKDSEKDKLRDKHRDRKESERERHRSSDRKERRDSKDEKERRHKHKKDRRSSKDDKERQKDTERKRKYSESRSDDRKRRDSEKSRHKEHDNIESEVESDKLEREKAVVSTSEDIVVDFQRFRRESFSNLDPDAKDSVPTSTVVGSPDIIELKDDGSKRGESPSAYPGSSPNSYSGYLPPLPGGEAPLPPPLPDSPPAPPYIDVPSSDSPATPPLPDSLDSPKTPSLPDEICLSPSTVDEDDFPNTPPLPDDDIPATPPLPSEIDSSLNYDKPSTPPLPFTKTSLPSCTSSSAENIDRLTPPIESGLGVGPSSSPVPSKSGEPIIVWKGAIHMTDVSKFYASAFEVSGKARFLPEDVPKVVEVVGRISPDNVWSYIAQTKKTGSKEILVVRFQPSNEEEKVSYIALYSYLSSKKRYGVIGNCDKEAVKDFYIVPLASHQPIPHVLLPLDGPGFEEHRAHMLIGVIIRAKHRRIYDHITGSWQIVGGSSSVQSNPLHKSSELPERSYTPPLPTDQESEEIQVPSTDSEDDAKFDERLTPPLKDRVVDSTTEFRAPGSHKRQSKSQSDFDQPKKRMSLDRRLQEVVADISTEPKSPAEFSFADGTLDQESMLAELNRQIEVHKKELSEMQKTVLNEEEEPYSPSMSNSASPGEEPLKLDTSKINIPSNLQEILNNIKEKELEIKNKEQEIKRRLSLAADPIVMNYAKLQDAEEKSSSGEKVPPSDVDLRPVLQLKPKDVERKEDVDLRILHGRDPKEHSVNNDVFGKSDDTDLRVRDPRLARAHAAAVMEAIEKGKTLGTLTDEELLAKALEMEGKENSNKQAQMNTEIESMFQPVPPPPFMAAGPSGYIPPPGHMVPPPNSMPCTQPPGMVGMSFMNQVAQPTQPIGLYGPGGGRDQGVQGPSCMPGPQHEPSQMGHHGISNPNTMGPPCGPPMHEGPGLPGCGPNPMEPPSRYGESSRYPDEGHWDRNYEDRDWDYAYNHYPKDDHYRNTERYREGECYRESDYFRDKDRDRDWRRRQDRDGGYKRQHFRKKAKFDRGGGGDHERRRSKQYDRGGDGDDSGYERRRSKQFESRGGNSESSNDGNHDRKRGRFSESSGRSKKKHERNRNWSNFENLHRANDDNRGTDDGDDCPYEIDY